MSYPILYEDHVHTQVVSDPGDDHLTVGIVVTNPSLVADGDPLWYTRTEARELAESILAYLDAPDPEKLMSQAALVGEVVAFTYRKSEDDEPEERTLRPSEVYESRAHDKLVIGYDEDRDDVRVFRLDRISNPRVVS